MPDDASQSNVRVDRFLLLVVACSIALAGTYLDQDFWYDEAYTLDNFVKLGFLGVFTDYHAPNNHMVFTALLAVALRLCVLFDLPGWCLRLLPLSCSAAAVGVLYWAVRDWRGRHAALWAALLLCTSQFFLNFCCQLRGYSLSALWTSLALLLGLQIVRRPATARIVGYALVSVLAVGTVPTNLIVFVFLGAWCVLTLLRRGHLSRPGGKLAAGVLVLAPPAGMGWYLRNGVLREQFFGHLGSGRENVLSPVGNATSLAAELGHGVCADFLWLLPLAAFGFILLILRELRERRGRRWEVPLMFAAATGPLLAGLAVSLFPRNFYPMLPWWYALFGVCLKESSMWLVTGRPRLHSSLRALLPLLVTLACVRQLTIGSRYEERFEGERPQGAYYQYYQAHFHPTVVVSYLVRARPRDRMVAFQDESDTIALAFLCKTASFDRLYRSTAPEAAKVFMHARLTHKKVLLISNSRTNALAALSAICPREIPLPGITKVHDTGFFDIYEVVEGREPAATGDSGPSP